MKKFIGILLFCSVTSATAQVAIHPTYPGTSVRDWSKPGVRIEGNRAYPTLPGTSVRDWSKPGFIISPSQPRIQPIPRSTLWRARQGNK